MFWIMCWDSPKITLLAGDSFSFDINYRYMFNEYYGLKTMALKLCSWVLKLG